MGNEGMTGSWEGWVPEEARRYLPDSDPSEPDDWRRHVPKQWRQWLDSSPAPRPQAKRLRFVTVDEDRPGASWRALFDETWPAYRDWWVGSGGATRPTRHEAEAALERHMPELIDTYAALVSLSGDDDTAAAMLTLWNPPPFIVACSQIVVSDPADGPVLVRNYDYDPRLFEASVHRTRRMRAVLGTGDCLWGLVDGMNDAGLAVSLTFGGRREIGEGFGIPLALRYVLEVATCVPEAVEILQRLPHQLSYNITLCDTGGAVATVFVAPDRPAMVTDRKAITNHPGTVEWPHHAAWTLSVERLDKLCSLDQSGAGPVVEAMLRPPLLARRWDEGFATLYTAAYHLANRQLTYHWPQHHVRLQLADQLPAAFETELAP
jgi:predicted choloylglycine hydrolase